MTLSQQNESDKIPIKIMGILNVTPDSFSDGGRYLSIPNALDRIFVLRKNGAKIIDIGGESTRPGSEPVTTQEELKRVIPILEAALETFPDLEYSIDTTKYEVAQKSLQIGATIVNDVSGLQKEPKLADLCADFDATLIIMHSKGNPKNMQESAVYENVVDEVSGFFSKQISYAQSKGVKKIILDPGIGFGKKLEHNLKLLAQLDSFQKFEFPLLVGASRKSMIGTILDNRSIDDRLIGTISVHYDALTKGAKFLRVHDVKEASDSVRIYNAIQSQK